MKDEGIAISCMICEEYVELTPEEESAIYHGKTVYKICDKCKEVVMLMRHFEVKKVDPNEVTTIYA